MLLKNGIEYYKNISKMTLCVYDFIDIKTPITLTLYKHKSFINFIYMWMPLNQLQTDLKQDFKLSFEWFAGHGFYQKYVSVLILPNWLSLDSEVC